jgi:hypothetical protein
VGDTLDRDSGPRIVVADEAWSVVTISRVLVTVWREAATAARIASLDRIVEQLVGEHHTFAAVTVLEPTASLRMEEDARRAAVGLQKRFAAQQRASAYLSPGTGFVPATVRLITTGIHLLSRTPYPVHVFAEVAPLTAWLAAYVDLPTARTTMAISIARGVGRPS